MAIVIVALAVRFAGSSSVKIDGRTFLDSVRGGMTDIHDGAICGGVCDSLHMTISDSGCTYDNEGRVLSVASEGCVNVWASQSCISVTAKDSFRASWVRASIRIGKSIESEVTCDDYDSAVAICTVFQGSDHV